VDDPDTILKAYVSGRGSFRLRAKVEIEREKGGAWHLLVSQIPYGVQKSKLIEEIAELIADKKLPILADVKDESDEQVRLILEPRARTVDADLLLEELWSTTVSAQAPEGEIDGTGEDRPVTQTKVAPRETPDDGNPGGPDNV